MTTKSQDARAEVVDAIVNRARDRVPADHLHSVEMFLREYYRHVAVDDMHAKDPIDLYGAAMAHLNLGRDRRPGTPAVHVYNPRFDEHGWQSTHTAVQLVND